VETRMAPPNTASGTVQSPIVPSAMSPASEAHLQTHLLFRKPIRP
jgi:hypothetical protein